MWQMDFGDVMCRKGYITNGDKTSSIALDVVGFLRARTSGDFEDKLHARDDWLFNVRAVFSQGSVSHSN
jgi:hypothetical protein